MALEWWLWIVLGIGLMLTELFVPMFVLVWFGLGAVLVGLAMQVTPGIGISTQLFLWTVASLAMTVLWFKVLRQHGFKTRAGMSDADVLGEVGVLTLAVGPYRRGRVRFQKPLMGSDAWECIADESIATNERVRVLAMEGNLLRVGKV